MAEDLDRGLGGFPVIIRFAPHWGEMDAYRHINNVAYFRWFESGRIAYFDRMGITDEGGRGIGPIMASTACRFRAPLTHPDVVRVGTRILAPDAGSDRFTMEHAVVSERLGRLVADGQCVIVAYDYARACKVEVPAAWREQIARIEGGAHGPGGTA